MTSHYLWIPLYCEKKTTIKSNCKPKRKNSNFRKNSLHSIDMNMINALSVRIKVLWMLLCQNAYIRPKPRVREPREKKNNNENIFSLLSLICLIFNIVYCLYWWNETVLSEYPGPEKREKVSSGNFFPLFKMIVGMKVEKEEEKELAIWILSRIIIVVKRIVLSVWFFVGFFYLCDGILRNLNVVFLCEWYRNKIQKRGI